MRDLADGQELNEVFVVRAHTRRQQRNGEPFLKLQLGDMTGAVEAVIWDEVDALAPICPAGSVVRDAGPLLGRRALRRRRDGEAHAGRQEDEYELGDLTEGPRGPTRRWSPISTR